MASLDQSRDTPSRRNEQVVQGFASLNLVYIFETILTDNSNNIPLFLLNAGGIDVFIGSRNTNIPKM